MAFKNLPPHLSLDDAISAQKDTLFDDLFDHYDKHGTFQSTADSSNPVYIEALMGYLYEALPVDYRQSAIDKRLREGFFLASKTAEIVVNRKIPFMQKPSAYPHSMKQDNYDRGRRIISEVSEYLRSNIAIDGLIYGNLDIIGGDQWSEDNLEMPHNPHRIIAGYAFRAIDIQTHEEYSRNMRQIKELNYLFSTS